MICTGKLHDVLYCCGKLAIALSGGVDSALLLAAAVEVLGTDNVLPLHCRGDFIAGKESKMAEHLCSMLGVKAHDLHFYPLASAEISSNPVERCYYCKKLLYSTLLEYAKPLGFNVLADGANVDDLGEFRPGQRAADELGVLHPFVKAALRKEDIRKLAKEYKLPNQDLPAAACLASRIPCGMPITAEKLKQIEEYEREMDEIGFSGHRVRHYGHLAKIEVTKEQFMLGIEKRECLVELCKRHGFSSAALDLSGYVTGAVAGHKT